jgi:hypothetical protein
MDKLFEGNEAGVEDVLQQVPMGRLGQAEEVARVVGFLLSSEASYVTVRALSLCSLCGVVLTLERNRERLFLSTEDGRPEWGVSRPCNYTSQHWVGTYASRILHLLSER